MRGYFVAKGLDRSRPRATCRRVPIHTETKGILVVLSSPSGGGKSSICRALLESDPKLGYSISVTSRPRRIDEVEGKDYHFVTEDDFSKLIAKDAFYEWARVHGNFYGTPRDLVDAQLAAGKDVVMDLDVNGGLAIKKLNDAAVLIFVLPPSIAVLNERLRRRNTDGDEVILRRLANARTEIHFAQKYDYVVVNENLQLTIEVIKRIVHSERYSSKHQVVHITGEDALAE